MIKNINDKIKKTSLTYLLRLTKKLKKSPKNPIKIKPSSPKEKILLYDICLLINKR